MELAVYNKKGKETGRKVNLDKNIFQIKRKNKPKRERLIQNFMVVNMLFHLDHPILNHY